MLFLMKERQAWIRTGTHTVVLDRDVDFARFSKDRSGEIARLWRLWLVNGETDQIVAYLGSFSLCDARTGQLRSVFRRAKDAAPLVGSNAAEMRHELASFLRQELTGQAASSSQ